MTGPIINYTIGNNVSFGVLSFIGSLDFSIFLDGLNILWGLEFTGTHIVSVINKFVDLFFVDGILVWKRVGNPGFEVGVFMLLEVTNVIGANIKLNTIHLFDTLIIVGLHKHTGFLEV